MYLIVGLGNPGEEYAHTRHNIGFMLADKLADAYDLTLPKQKFQGEIFTGDIAGEKIIVLKPQTYMNLSGQSVAAAMKFYKLTPAQVIVLHDELDLPLGRVKTKIGGGDGGHNGIKNIDAHIGPEYKRVRIGIGHPGDKDAVSDYVLHDFSKAESEQLEKILEALAKPITALLAGDDAGFLNQVALALQPPKAKKESA